MPGQGSNTRRQLSALWPWAPLVPAGIYALVLLSSLRSVVHAISQSADTVSAPVIGELSSNLPHGTQVVLGNIPWYPALWFEWLTRGLPAHRQIWEVAPWLFSLIGIALVSWSAVRASGRWAGAMVAVLLACASPTLLVYQFSWSVHALTYVHVCVLGAFLVLLCEHGGMIRGSWIWHWTCCVAVGAMTAVCLASDKLVAVAGIAPFVLAAIVVAWSSPASTARRLAASTATIVAISVAGSSLITAAMTSARVVAYPFPITFSALELLTTHLRLLAQSLAFVFNGNFGGAMITVRSVIELACALAVTASVVFAVRFARDWVVGAVRLGRERTRRSSPADAARTAYLSFWTLSAVMLGSAYVVTSVPTDVFTSRYVVTVGYAIAAVVTVALNSRRWGRAAFVTGVCVLTTGSILGTTGNDLQASLVNFPNQSLSWRLLDLAGREHLKYGYAGYWDSAPLTWQTRTRVQVYPVEQCGNGQVLCPFPYHKISSWYTPRAGARTFLIVDSRQVGVANAPAGPAASLGHPEQVVTIGRLTVYIYGYDIALKFGP